MVLTWWRCFRGVSNLALTGCGHLFPAVSPTTTEMSSTLFNRGMTTQVGMRRRAEEVKKSIDELRSTVTGARSMQATIDELSRENTVLRAMVAAMEGRISTLEKTASAAAPEIDVALTGRVDAIESQLSTVAITATQLQSRTGSLEASTSSISNRVSALESTAASTSDRMTMLDSNLQGRIVGVELSTAAVSDRITALENRQSA